MGETADREALLRLIGCVYHCAAGEAEWSAFLAEFAREFPALKPVLAGYDTGFDALNFMLSEGLPDDAQEAYVAHYHKINPWNGLIATLPPPPDVRWSESFISDRDLRRTEFYNDFVRPLDDARGGFGVSLVETGQAAVVLHANFNPRFRAEAERAARLLSALGPHLARGLDLYRQVRGLALERRRLEAILEHTHDAVFVLDERSRLEFANANARRLLAERRIVRQPGPGGPVVFTSSVDQREMQRRIAEAAAVLPSAQRAEYRLRSTRTAGPTYAQVAPLIDGAGVPGDAVAGLLAPRAILLIITLPQGVQDHRAAVQRELGLTHAEWRLVAALLEGKTIKDHCAAAGITYHTARSHLKAVFAKTHTSRQLELIQFLNRRFGA